ncbi:methyltransferase domain-containing protein [Catellatospora sp. KI3]|uniref:class I SAM-dependent methyltransferase n=1 Tax=Catellatospora sp. KI3 TaxID=3041620 RepID=UPI002482A62D|nr:methyltransferase domain-containing protein [Catellatospora sp. KI3]MDI1463587.1 methyltransferase domain-containing protein [Catellatospora sp. KI3]
MSAGWDWEDPARVEALTDEFMLGRIAVAKLEVVASGPVFGRERLAELGITGIEFAALKTLHPTGLGTDLTGLRCGDATTRRQELYRVDGECWFTELDICEPLPFEDSCVEWVYAEHLIEHVSMTAAIGWLAEVRRILAPGGVLRLTTPDLRKYAESYLRGDGFFAKHRGRMAKALGGVAPPMPARGAFMFNQLFYLYGHRWIYDLDELTEALTRAGFDPAAIRVCGFRTGARPDVALLDQMIRNDETLYVEIDV